MIFHETGQLKLNIISLLVCHGHWVLQLQNKNAYVHDGGPMQHLLYSLLYIMRVLDTTLLLDLRLFVTQMYNNTMFNVNKLSLYCCKYYSYTYHQFKSIIIMGSQPAD